MKFKYSFYASGKTINGVRARLSGHVFGEGRDENQATWNAIYNANDSIMEMSPGFVISGTNGRVTRFPTVKKLKSFKG